MKIIQRPFFLLLWSAKLALSQTDAPLPTDISEFPLCAQECLSNSATAYCLLDAMMGCICQRSAVGFFQLLSFCVNSVCSAADGTKTINMVLDACTKHGYNPKALITLSPTLPTLNNLPLSSWTMLPNPSRTETTTSNPTSTSAPSKGPVMSTVAIIGIVVGGVAVIGIIAFLIVFCMRHRARVQAMAAVAPPPAAAVSHQPPQPPPGYPSHMEPLMQGYNELEQPASGYYAPHKEANVVPSLAPTPVPTFLGPVPPPGYQGQSFQELPAQQGRIQGGQGLAQEGNVFVEMPGDNRRR